MKSILKTIKLLKNPVLFVCFTLIVSLFIKANDTAPTDLKLQKVLERSGIAAQYPIFSEIVKMRSDDFHFFPTKLVTEESTEREIFNFIKNSLTPEEIDQLADLFQLPFLSKISKIYFSPVKDKTDFDHFIAKHGHKAKREKVALLTKINKIMHADYYLFNFRLAIERALKMQQLRGSPDHTNDPIEDLEKQVAELTTGVIEKMTKEHPRFLMQFLYYKNRYTTDSELAEFHRQFHDNALLNKFYNLYQSAIVSYSNKLYEKLIPEIKNP